MLDIVQSFTLLSYCIVSPIYISPICNVEIHYYEKIKLGILYFSLFTVLMFCLDKQTTFKSSKYKAKGNNISILAHQLPSFIAISLSLEV